MSIRCDQYDHQLVKKNSTNFCHFPYLRINNLITTDCFLFQMHQHFILHKPYGYLSQFVNNQNKRRNKKLLGELNQFPEGTMAIGRLDETSEGILLLTTDGQISEAVRSKTIEKEYYVELDGEITPKEIGILKSGVEISLNGKKYSTIPCKAKLLDSVPFPDHEATKERHRPSSWISITITEGKFRQVRKMTAKVGFPTLRLVRVRIGNIYLNDLEPGSFIRVDEFNI